MKVKLFDAVGYQLHVTEIDDCPQVLIWGKRVFVKFRKRSYQEVRYVVVKDTATDLFKTKPD